MVSASDAGPIIVSDRGDIRIFESISEVRNNLEAIDVNAGTYEAFDTRGRPVALTATGYEVNAEILSDEDPDENSLVEVLRNFIQKVGPQRFGLIDWKNADLATLVETIRRF
jgi:hypothetical protein